MAPLTDEAVWHDRIRGLLLGGALGDAVGAPFEGALDVDPRHLERVIGGDEPLRWTDDTALQLALAQHLTGHAGDAEFGDDELLLALAEAWRIDPDRGYGPNPPRIFAAALAGEDWRPHVRGAFGGGGSLGNGGAMRAAPVGAVPGGTDRVAEVARRSAAVTHAHPVGQEGAAVIAVAAHCGLRSQGRPDPDDLLSTCAAVVSTDELRNGLRAVEAAAAQDDPLKAAALTGNGVAAHESVAAALAAALAHPDDPLAAISFAVRMAGDADTIAAMAGSLVGAWCGAEALPSRLVARLEDRAHIEDVAARLASATRR